MQTTDDAFSTVKHLAQAGLSDYKIAAMTGIPRGTVQRWRHRLEAPLTRRRAASARAWRIDDAAVYCYLLGSYLGDGHVTHRPPNGWTLRVACDERYGEIIREVLAAMATVFPGGRPTRIHSSSGASEIVTISHPAVGLAFPQHGAGRKHLRPIVLTDWQLELTHADPGALIRGLIHSDGCRAENRFRTQLPSGRVAEYHYVRYFFSNLSEDIRRIFSDHCALLGIRVTQSNHRNLSVSRRNSVTILDRIVGPKS